MMPPSPSLRTMIMLAAISITASAPLSFAQPATAPADAEQVVVINPRPDDQPETAESFLKDQQQSLEQLRAQFKAVPARPIDAIIRYDIAEGMLVCTLAEPKVEQDIGFSPDGEGSVFRLNVQELAMPRQLLPMVHLMKLDAAGLRALNVEAMPNPHGMGVTVTTQTPGTSTIAQLVQQSAVYNGGDGPVARLYMQQLAENDEGNIGRDVSAANFAGLIEAHHDDALAMLGEGLTALRAMHVLSGVSQAEARAMMDASQTTDAATGRELDAIVALLETGGSDAVPDARMRLRKLGSAAAAALHHRKRDGWSAELSLNIDTVTADLMPGGAERSAKLLSSPTRLIDLLYSSDVVVRRGALERLSTLTGEKLAIDPEADPYAKVAQIEAIRGQLAPPTPRE